MENENSIIKDRKRKIELLREQGINPYPHTYKVKHRAGDIKEKHKDIEPGERTGDKVSVGGRIKYGVFAL